jgi:2-polyprenyl-6-methoxyphenol hydroxylase-like FAD-dependent oxidoreductase
MIDFFGPGYDAAEKIGMLPGIEGLHYQIPRLAFLDAAGGEKFSVGYAALRKDLLDDRHFNFMRGDLQQLLHSEIQDHVEVRFGVEVEAFEQHDRGVHVELTDGTAGTFDLLVGADGVHSRVRRLAFGDESRFWRPLGYRAAAFTVDDSDVRARLEDAFYTLTEPGRQVAVYPIRGGRLVTLFIHKSRRGRRAPTKDLVGEEMRAAYGSMGWIVPELLERCPAGSGLFFDEVGQIEMPHWRIGRVVLVGDACQCVSLLAGQGASLAVAGACVLAEELAAGKADIGCALARYESRLKPAVERRQKAGRRLARWFVPDDRAHLLARDVAMRLATGPLAPLSLGRRFF